MLTNRLKCMTIRQLLIMLLTVCFIQLPVNAGGLTLITHGFRPIGEPTSTPAWIDAMADEIAERTGTPSQCSIWEFSVIPDLPYLYCTPVHESGPYGLTNDFNGEFIVKINWQAVAGCYPYEPVSTGLVAEVIALELLTSEQTRTWLEQPIHLIGHSRGGSLMAALARELGEAGIWVDHLTTLDPHPVDGVNEDCGYTYLCGSIDFGDYTMDVTENVVFADNYYRFDDVDFEGCDPDGESVFGAFNVLFAESLLNDSGYLREHDDVHLWYHGTVDWFGAFDGEFAPNHNWYNSDDYQRGPRFNVGFNWGRIARGKPWASDVARLGYHRDLEIQGWEGQGWRNDLDWSTAHWPNVIGPIINVGPTIEIGTDIPLSYYYHDIHSNLSVSYYLDDDANFYNGHAHDFGGAALPQSQSSLPGLASTNLSTDGLEPGSYYVVVKVSSGARQRMAVAGVIDLTSPGNNNLSTVSLVASPLAIPVDGSSFVHLTATITDAAGEPNPGVQVSFDRVTPAPGPWVNCSTGEPITGPNNGLTDSQGRRTTCYRPTNVGTFTFEAVTAHGSAEATFDAVGPSNIDIELTISARNEAGRYRVEARFTDAVSGNPLEIGQAYFHSTLGSFDGGSATICDEINSVGRADATLFTSVNGNATISVCFIDDDDAVCQASSICVTQQAFLNCCEPPLTLPMFSLMGPNGTALSYIATGEGGSRLAAVEDQRGLVVWDAFTWELINYTAMTSPSAIAWARHSYEPTISYAWNSPKVAIANWKAVALVNLSSGQLIEHEVEHCEEFPSDPEEESALAPNGSTYVLFTQCNSSCCVGYRVERYGATLTPSIVIDSLSEDIDYGGIEYAYDGSRYAYVFSEDISGPDPIHLVIRNSADTLLFTQIIGYGEPVGVAWSPDSMQIAVNDGEGSIHIYSRSGQFIRQIPILADDGDVSWSPDNIHIATKLGSNVFVYRSDNGQLIGKFRAGDSGGGQWHDKVAWRSDGQVLFVTDTFLNKVHVYAPFDSDRPNINISNPISGSLISGEYVTVTGTVTDNVGIPPNALSWKLDNGPSQEAALSAGGVFDLQIPVSPGLHSLCIRVYDISGLEREVCVDFERLGPPEMVVSFNGLPVSHGATVELGTGETGVDLTCGAFVIQNVGGLPLNFQCPTLAGTFQVIDCSVENLDRAETATFGVCLIQNACGDFSVPVTIISNSVATPDFSFYIDASGYVLWGRDADDDSFGDPNNTIESCTQPAGYVDNYADCDDDRASVYPGADEVCDGMDNDCDGDVDEDGPIWFHDGDGDGFGDATDFLQTCAPPGGYVMNSDDCDDSDPNKNPIATDLCGEDRNCDGVAPQPTLWYRDGDEDTFGDPNFSIEACDQPYGFVLISGDCDDSDPNENPNAADLCGEDRNCDGIFVTPTLWFHDSDGDGFGDATSMIQSCDPPGDFVSNGDDCDDTDPDVNPGASDLCNEDRNCDGFAPQLLTWYRDNDGDGFGTPNITIEDCDPPAGYVANDEDCDDEDADISPNTPEVCDGRDRNCDGDISSIRRWCRDADGDGFGDSNTLMISCQPPQGYVENCEDCDDRNALVHPEAGENCNDSFDNNCDGLIDCNDSECVGIESCPCAIGQDFDGDGLCDPLDSDDDNDGQPDSIDCAPRNETVHAGAEEICDDGIDNDCDGLIDDFDLDCLAEPPISDPLPCEQELCGVCIAPTGIGFIASFITFRRRRRRRAVIK